MKFTQKMHQSITFQTTSSTCSCLQNFPPNKIENLNSWTSEVIPRVLTKEWRVGGARDRLQNGGGEGWRGGQKIDFKMEADHDWSPDTRLKGCAGPLVADI